ADATARARAIIERAVAQASAHNAAASTTSLRSCCWNMQPRTRIMFAVYPAQRKPPLKPGPCANQGQLSTERIRVPPIPFAGNPLDRAGQERTDPAWLAAQKTAGLFLPFWQNRPLVRADQAAFLRWRVEWETCLCVFL